MLFATVYHLNQLTDPDLSTPYSSYFIPKQHQNVCVARSLDPHLRLRPFNFRETHGSSNLYSACIKVQIEMLFLFVS